MLKMEPTQCSETSAFNTQTPVKYPEDILSKQRVILYKKRFFSALFVTSVSGITDKFRMIVKTLLVNSKFLTNKPLFAISRRKTQCYSERTLVRCTDLCLETVKTQTELVTAKKLVPRCRTQGINLMKCQT
jgi:hypothetical protein